MVFDLFLLMVFLKILFFGVNHRFWRFSLLMCFKNIFGIVVLCLYIVLYSEIEKVKENLTVYLSSI